MATETTAAQYTKQGNVIFHPHFDRPKVEQPKRKGRHPKGVVSFWREAMRVERQRRDAPQPASAVNALPEHAQQRIAGFICGLTGADYGQALTMAGRALGELNGATPNAGRGQRNPPHGRLLSVAAAHQDKPTRCEHEQ